MSTEIDRFLRSAQLDPKNTRRVHRGSAAPVLLTARQKRQELRDRLGSVLVLLFNDPLPCERLTIICGRSHEYWRGVLGKNQKGEPRLTREALKLLIPALRAHIAGVRDHLLDVEGELVRVTDALDEPELFRQ